MKSAATTGTILCDHEVSRTPVLDAALRTAFRQDCDDQSLCVTLALAVDGHSTSASRCVTHMRAVELRELFLH